MKHRLGAKRDEFRAVNFVNGKTVIQLLMVSASTSLVGGAQAQNLPSKVYVGLSQSMVHDTNIFRSPDGSPRSGDMYGSTSLLGGYDLSYGRQRLYGSGSISNNQYKELSRLDHVGYSLNMGLDWATVGRISGNLDFVQNRGLADYGGDSDPRLSEKNLETNQQITATARVGVMTRATLEATLQHRDVSYSAAQFDFREFNQDASSLALRYQISSGLSMGGGLRYTQGKFPLFRQNGSGNYLADRYSRRDLDLTANWTPSGRSSVVARVSIGSQSNTEAIQNDFSGVTGALTWTYQPSGKLQFVSSLIRDTGSESRFTDFGPSETFRSDTSRLTNSVKVTARYDATAKIQVTAGAAYSRRSLTDSLFQSGAGSSNRSGEDATTRVTLGVRYLPGSNAALECNLANERRSANTTLSYAYSGAVVSCSAQFRLRLL